MAGFSRPAYEASELARLIDPKVVAVVGASGTPGSFGERTLSNMAQFSGEVFAINPKYRTLLDRPCIPSLADLPRSPDCVVLCVARQMVPGLVREMGAVGGGGAGDEAGGGQGQTLVAAPTGADAE